MTDKPEALRLAAECDTGHPLEEDAKQAAAELRRLSSVERAYDVLALAYNEWTEKTQWVQETKQTHELGMHRADVLKQRIERLQAANLKLAGAIDMIRETLKGGNVDDLLYIINTALEEHRGNNG
jgi:hypothetical protein